MDLTFDGYTVWIEEDEDGHLNIEIKSLNETPIQNIREETTKNETVLLLRYTTAGLENDIRYEEEFGEQELTKLDKEKSLAYNLGFDAGLTGEFADWNMAFDAALQRNTELDAAYTDDPVLTTDEFLDGYSDGEIQYDTENQEE